MQTEAWRDFWEYLELRYTSFGDLGLTRADPDAVVWQRCQEEGILLITDNRNDDGPQSLAATIRAHNSPQSLPVFTVSDARRLARDAVYADRVIDRLFQYLLEVENIRGTGRLYLP
jgi:hypothetical protein